MLLKGRRGTKGLDDHRINHCKLIWEALGGSSICPLDCSEAKLHGSKTRFSQKKNIVFLGADVVPGLSADPRSRMSEMACLAHEMAHAERFSFGLDRDANLPHKLRDEAETSLHASWNILLNITDRNALIEDARDLIDEWLKGAENES